MPTVQMELSLVTTEIFVVNLGVFSIGLCVLLSVFLLLAKGALRQANSFLAAFLLLTAIDMLGWSAPLLPAAVRALLPYRLPLAYLQMPLLFAYVVALSFPARRTLPHLVVAAVVATLSAVIQIAEFEGHVVTNNVALHLQFYLYIVWMAVVLVQYRRCYRQTYSHPEAALYKWLALVVIVSFAAHTLVLIKSWAWLSEWPMAPRLELVVAVVAVAVTGALTLSAMLHQEWFLGIPADAPATKPPVDRSTVSDAARGAPAEPHGDVAELLARLRTFMQTQQPFLDPMLTIRSLSRRLGLGQRELSMLINQQLGVHFFDFVNRYRVEYAAERLCDRSRQDVPVVDIAFEAGFNTKSSFNTAFKKHMAMTPSVYRQRAIALATDTGPGRA